MAKAKKNIPPVPNKAKSVVKEAKGSRELLYGKEFFIWMTAGFLLIVLGFILMAGGNQAPNEWNADEIYSFRRTVLAPFVMIVGLVVEVYAIFKK